MNQRREPDASEAPKAGPSAADLQQSLEMAELVAHEINNLLNNILLNVAVLDRKRLEAARSELANIRQAGTRAGSVLNRWQQFNPRRPVALQPLDVNPVVAEAVASWQPAGQAGGARPRFEPAAGLEPVLADPAELQRLVRLLLTSAASVCPPGDVAVRTEASQGEVLLVVEDAGPDVEPGQLDRVFEPFFVARPATRGSDADPERELGLALARKLARRQQGTIHAENRPEGGLRVVVHLRTAKRQ